MALNVAARSGSAELAKLKSDWDTLFKNSDATAYYNDWRWHWAIARHLIDDEISYLLVSDGALLIAIVPLLVVDRAIYGLHVKSLEFPTDPHVPLCDIVVHRKYLRAPIVDVVVRYLTADIGLEWHRASFRKFTERSCLFRLCDTANFALEHDEESYYLSVGEKDILSMRVSRKQLRNVRRIEDRARQKFGTLTTRYLHTEAELVEGFESFCRLESSGWKGAAGSAIALDPRLKDFYLQVIQSFGQTEQASIPILEIGGQAVAGQLTVHCENVQFVLRLGYDEAYASVAPGNILLKQVLEHESARGNEINLVTAPDWADRWHLASEKTYLLSLYNRTAYGQLLRFLRFLLTLSRGSTRK